MKRTLSFFALFAGAIVASDAAAQQLRQPWSSRPVAFNYDYANYGLQTQPSPSDQPLAMEDADVVKAEEANAASGCGAGGCNSSCPSCGKCACHGGCNCGDPWRLFDNCCCLKHCGIEVTGHIEQGFTWNPDDPANRLNFGRLFDDRSNDYRLNQTILTFEKALDPEPCCSDWGFKAQLMYGSDARFIHSLGFMDNVTDDPVQPDIVEMYGNWHLPILTEGGVDVKVGQFVTLMGAEVINAIDNPLYSHSWIFNFGIPFKHTGFMATTHITDQFDLHTGLVVGINTGSFDDNNDVLSFHGGFMWKSCDESLTIPFSMHIGAENDTNFNTLSGIPGFDANHDLRYIFTSQPTYNWSENVKLITDLNWGWDEGFDAEWYGAAQYWIYAANECTNLVARLEVWRDDDGFAAFEDTSNDGFIDLEHGIPGPNGFGALLFGGDNTYTSLTLGVTHKPSPNLILRPEVRMDWVDVGSLGIAPFDDFTDNNQMTVGMDAIWQF
jgi:hypothetical protein